MWRKRGLPNDSAPRVGQWQNSDTPGKFVEDKSPIYLSTISIGGSWSIEWIQSIVKWQGGLGRLRSKHFYQAQPKTTKVALAQQGTACVCAEEWKAGTNLFSDTITHPSLSRVAEEIKRSWEHERGISTGPPSNCMGMELLSVKLLAMHCNG